MAAPTFVSATATNYGTKVANAAAKTTATIAVQNGDILVAHAVCESAGVNNGTTNVTVSTASGSTSAWTNLQTIPGSTNANSGYIRSAWATATATGNITVSFTLSITGSTGSMGGVVKVWRNASLGTSASGNNGTGSGAPSVSITTTAANSGLDFGSDDWNATAGTVTFTASAGTSVQDVSDQTTAGTTYCVYSSHVVDAGAAGAKTIGMSAPSTQRYVATAVEIKGSGAAPAASLGTLSMMGVG